MHGIKIWKWLNWPNRISLMRLLLVIPFVLLLLNLDHYPPARYWAMAIFAVMAVSDFVDGQLARRMNLRTRLGAILDPLADKVLIVCATVLLALPASSVPGFRLPAWVAVIVIGKDLWVVMGFVVVYLVTDKFCVAPTWSGKTSTLGQLLMVACVLLAPNLERWVPGLGRGVTTGAWWLISGLTAAAVLSYTRLGLSFIAREQKPLDDPHPGEHPGKRPGSKQEGAASHDEFH